MTPTPKRWRARCANAAIHPGHDWDQPYEGGLYRAHCPGVVPRISKSFSTGRWKVSFPHGSAGVTRFPEYLALTLGDALHIVHLWWAVLRRPDDE
jgi:hypothetical protein